MKYIAYYRVSTQRQAESHLGLDAQREAVKQHTRGGELLAAFEETESGKRANNRPQLQAALAECKATGATLVIAKLDRLSRNVHFLTGLLEAKVELVACDLPGANKFTLQIMACVAEQEREMISARTRAALAAAKAKGTVLGNPRLSEARERARATHFAHRPAAPIVGMIADWHGQGMSYREIARRLNALNVRPARGKAWYGSSVAYVLGKAA
jgi:DNA invertase Pin-like site-specific DNA recombinase